MTPLPMLTPDRLDRRGVVVDGLALGRAGAAWRAHPMFEPFDSGRDLVRRAMMDHVTSALDDVEFAVLQLSQEMPGLVLGANDLVARAGDHKNGRLKFIQVEIDPGRLERHQGRVAGGGAQLRRPQRRPDQVGP